MAHESPWICAIDKRQTDKIPKTLQLLSNLDMNVFEHVPGGCGGALPIDLLADCVRDADNVEVLLDAYNILLNAMKKQNDSKLPIPLHVVINLEYRFFGGLTSQYIPELRGETIDLKLLSFLLAALCMALKAGVNMEEKTRPSSTPLCNCYMPVSVSVSVLCIRSVIRYSVLNDLVRHEVLDGVKYEADPILFAKIREFYETLFIYGNKPDRNWSCFFVHVVSVARYQKLELLKVAEMALSLVDHKDWKYVQRKLHILYNKTISSSPANSEEEDMKAKQLELIQTFKGPKSLQDMCRKVIYDNIRDRRMVEYVGYLQLPKPLIQYLLFQ